MKLTWCDNGIQSEAAVAVSGCLASCRMFKDWQLLAACLLLLPLACSKCTRSLCIIHDVQAYLKLLPSVLASSTFSG